MLKTMKYMWMLIVPMLVLGTSCHRDEPKKNVAMNFTSSVLQAESVTPGAKKSPAEGMGEMSVEQRGGVTAVVCDGSDGVTGMDGIESKNGMHKSPMGSTTPLEETGIRSFRVWSYKTMGYSGGVYLNYQTVMNRYIVNWVENTAGTTSSNTADWEYVGVTNSFLPGEHKQTIKYWDFGATSYRFFGFAPHDESGIEYGQGGNPEPREDSDGNWWYDISFLADANNPAAAPYVSKLWFSNNAPSAKYQYGEQVVMEFIKPVTKVRIELYNSEGHKIEDPYDELGILSLTFAPASGETRIVQSGKLRVSYAITGPVTIAYYTPSVEIVGDPTGTVEINRRDSDYDNWYNVLPHVTQGAFQLVYNTGGSPKIAVVPEQYMSWQPNMEYTYRFKLMDGDFQFIDIVQIGVTGWQEESDNHDIYNW